MAAAMPVPAAIAGWFAILFAGPLARSRVRRLTLTARRRRLRR
jgi:hypothetical protein